MKQAIIDKLPDGTSDKVGYNLAQKNYRYFLRSETCNVHSLAPVFVESIGSFSKLKKLDLIRGSFIGSAFLHESDIDKNG